MIHPKDIEIVNKIKGLLKPDNNKKNNVDWAKVEMNDTLDRLVHNLQVVAPDSYRYASAEDIKNNFYTASCPKCGWWGSSKHLLGGGQIADSGDYGDVYCPICGNREIDEKEELSI